MRSVLVGIIILVLLVVVATAACLFVPSPLQKWAVERGATLATGRQVTLGEPFRLTAWPPVTITAADIRVANADWGKADTLARAEGLDARVDLLAFWRENRIKVERLIVTRPQLDLEVREDGRRNWELGGASQDQAAASEPAASKPIPGFDLGDVRVEGGLVTFDDRARMVNRRAEAIDLAINQPGADQPIKLDGGLTMAGKRATLAGTAGRPRDLAAGEPSPIGIDLAVPGGTLGFDGTVVTSPPAAKGGIRINLPQPRELASWLGRQLPLPDGALRSLALQGRLDLTVQRSALEDMEVQVDDVSGSGRVAAALANPIAVEGELGMGRVDLTPYLPPAATASQPTSAKPQAAVLTEEWSDAPIVLPLPLPIDVDFRLRMDGVKARQLELGAVNARLQADRQQATVTIDELQAYGGRLAGDARATPSNPPTYAVELRSHGIGFLAMLQALTGKGRFDGKADVGLRLAAAGDSERQLVRGVGGEGKIVLRDGAILGINIAGMLRQIMTLGLNPGATEHQRTDFAEAGGTFKIKDGVLHNEDFYLRAPVLRLDGAGSVDLPQRTVDYRITPRIATTLQGQDATGEPVLQAGIPFLLQGPFASPSVRFDLNGTLTSAISGPEDVARLAADLAKSPEAVDAVRKQFNLLKDLPAPAAGEAIDAVKDVLGNGSGKGKGKPAVPNVGKAAKGLLKGLTGQ
jgi:AsmA protein